MCIFVGVTDFVKCGALTLVDEIPRCRNYHCYYYYHYYYVPDCSTHFCRNGSCCCVRASNNSTPCVLYYSALRQQGVNKAFPETLGRVVTCWHACRYVDTLVAMLTRLSLLNNVVVMVPRVFASVVTVRVDNAAIALFVLENCVLLCCFLLIASQLFERVSNKKREREKKIRRLQWGGIGLLFLFVVCVRQIGHEVCSHITNVGNNPNDRSHPPPPPLSLSLFACLSVKVHLGSREHRTLSHLVV